MDYKNPQWPVRQRVTDLLARLDLHEKIGQLRMPMAWRFYSRSGHDVSFTADWDETVGKYPVGCLWAFLRADPWTGKTSASGLSPEMAPAVVNRLQRDYLSRTRHGIPLLLAEESPHGFMGIGATVFPTGVGMGCSWNPSLVKEAASAMASEIRAVGAHVGFGPNMDIVRDPRWGRVEENFGEDPELMAQFGEAWVEGMQSASLENADAAISCLKVLIAHGNPEGGHNCGPAMIGRRELHERFLPPLERAVRRGAAGAMTCYNEIDGIPATSDPWLFKSLLRECWRFRGFVVSDLFAIQNLYHVHGVAADLAEAAARALTAGVDIDLSGDAYAPHLEQALAKGLIKMEDIDAAVANVLETKFRLGLFEKPYVDESRAPLVVNCEEHRDIALRLARESLVLLKNSGVLPLDVALLRNIAVIGPNADNVSNQLGDYTAPQPDGKVVTVLDGLRKIASSSLKIFHAEGCRVRDPDRSGFDDAVALAREADAVVMVLGGSSAREFGLEHEATGAAKAGGIDRSRLPDMESGEGMDRCTLDVPGVQLELLRAIRASTTAPLVTVLIKGRPLIVDEVLSFSDAVLDAWYPGEMGGLAVAEVLFGRYNPAGRLCVSVPASVGQLPVHYNHKPGARRDYLDGSGLPSFSFGHGLSYTNFEYSNLEIPACLDASKGFLLLRVDVRNTGAVAGDEVVQVYVRDLVGSVTTPVKALKDFARVHLVPGESRTVSFTIPLERFALWNREAKYVVEAGWFLVEVGASSDDIRMSSRVEIAETRYF